jgi:hypothetical protein
LDLDVILLSDRLREDFLAVDFIDRFVFMHDDAPKFSFDFARLKVAVICFASDFSLATYVLYFSNTSTSCKLRCFAAKARYSKAFERSAPCFSSWASYLEYFRSFDKFNYYTRPSSASSSLYLSVKVYKS